MSDLEVFDSSLTLPEDFSYLVKPLHDGVQVYIRFPNGYGLSIVRHMYSYGSASGQWEAAAIRFNSNEWRDWDFIGRTEHLPGFEFDDVRGWLIESDIDELIMLVADL